MGLRALCFKCSQDESLTTPLDKAQTISAQYHIDGSPVCVDNANLNGQMLLLNKAVLWSWDFTMQCRCSTNMWPFPLQSMHYSFGCFSTTASQEKVLLAPDKLLESLFWLIFPQVVFTSATLFPRQMLTDQGRKQHRTLTKANTWLQKPTPGYRLSHDSGH